MTTIYNNFKELLFNGGIDLDNDTLQVALISDSPAYTPDPDNDVFVSDVLDDVAASELSGTGYTRQTVSMSITQDNANDQAVADTADLTYSGIDAGTIDGMILFKQGPTDDSDSPLIAHLTSPEFPLVTNGGDVNLLFDAAGVLTLG